MAFDFSDKSKNKNSQSAVNVTIAKRFWGIIKNIYETIFNNESGVLSGIFIVCIFLYLGHSWIQRDTAMKNLPTCPDNEKVTIGYRNGKPMKLCDQTLTFIAQDFNYSCILSGNGDYGTLGFARSAIVKEINVSEVDAVLMINKSITDKSGCNFGRLTPSFIQMGYTGAGDKSHLTHTKTMGF